MDIVTIFCDIDDFCLIFEPHWHRRLLTDGTRQRAINPVRYPWLR
jgi:hypothetical protein